MRGPSNYGAVVHEDVIGSLGLGRVPSRVSHTGPGATMGDRGRVRGARDELQRVVERARFSG
jgi:hypothetical protein